MYWDASPRGNFRIPHWQVSSFWCPRTDSTPWILDINAVDYKHLLFLQNSVRKHAFATKNCIISCWLFLKIRPCFPQSSGKLDFWTGISYSRVARSSGITMHCLVFDFIAIFTLHNAVFHYSTKASLHHLKVITVNFPTKKHTSWRKNHLFPKH